jgi:hypothetical protein
MAGRNLLAVLVLAGTLACVAGLLAGCGPTSVTVMDANRITLNVYITVEPNAVQVSIPVSVAVHFDPNSVPVTIPVNFAPTVNIQGHLLGVKEDPNE